MHAAYTKYCSLHQLEKRYKSQLQFSVKVHFEKSTKEKVKNNCMGVRKVSEEKIT